MLRDKISNYIILLLLAFAMSSCASTTPLPKTINIIPPDPDIEPKIGAFSGAWKGIFFGALNVTLVVEKINNNKAEIIYSWGDTWNIPGGYHYATVDVISGPAIEWIDRDKNKYTFIMNDDLKSLTGILHDPVENFTFKAQMKRYELE